MTVGERLKELRNKKGVTGEQLSEKTGIPAGSIRGLENKENRVPRMDRLKILATYYGVTTDYLLGAEPVEFNMWENRAITAENEVKRLNEIIKTIKDLLKEDKPNEH